LSLRAQRSNLAGFNPMEGHRVPRPSESDVGAYRDTPFF